MSSDPFQKPRYRKGRAIKAIEWLVRTIILTFPIWRTRKNLTAKLDAIESLTETLNEQREFAVTSASPHYVRVYDASLFIALLANDILISRGDQLIEHIPVKKNYYSRQLCLLLFEAIEDLPSVLGKDFRKALLAIPVDAGLVDELNQITKKLARLSHNYSADLKKIRTVAGAHRDHDASLQLSVIKTIDSGKIAQIAGELDSILDELVRWFTKIMGRMREFGILIRHIQIPTS